MADKMKAIRYTIIFALFFVAAGPVLALAPESAAVLDEPSRSEAPGTTGPYPAKPPNKACPQTTYIHCMPPVPKERRSMSSDENLKWVREHCPGIEVVY